MKNACIVALAVVSSLLVLLFALLAWYTLTEHRGWHEVGGYALLALGALYVLRRLVNKIAREMI